MGMGPHTARRVQYIPPFSSLLLPPTPPSVQVAWSLSNTARLRWLPRSSHYPDHCLHISNNVFSIPPQKNQKKGISSTNKNRYKKATMNVIINNKWECKYKYSYIRTECVHFHCPRSVAIDKFDPRHSVCRPNRDLNSSCATISSTNTPSHGLSDAPPILLLKRDNYFSRRINANAPTKELNARLIARRRTPKIKR